MKTAYPITSNPVTITIYANIPFDNTYKNHTIISDLFRYNSTRLYTGTTANTGVPKERFLNRKQALAPQGNYFYYPRWTFTDTFNFHYSNGLIGSVVLELTPAQTNANYMKVVSGTDTYYYFITAINQLNEDTYTLSLELDVLMTYQDEFLSSMQGTGSSNRTPVFTIRKHCHSFDSTGLVPYGVDLKTGDSLFAGIKPYIIKDIYDMGFKDENLRKIKDFVWLYICTDAQEYTETSGGTTYNRCITYAYKNIEHPLAIACLPISKTGKTLTITCSGDTLIDVTSLTKDSVLQKLVGNGSIHACKVSPYPPFSVENMTITSTVAGVTIDVPSSMHTSKNVTDSEGSNVMYIVNTAKSDLVFHRLGSNHKWFFIANEKDSTIAMSDLLLGLKRTTALTINDTRRQDPKLLFAPFRKYLISSPYGSCEIFPEIYYSSNIISGDTLSFSTITTSYVGDNTIYTYLSEVKNSLNNNLVVGYNKENIGLSANVNYIIPAGENALDVFNSTQANSFYQSKVASGITSGLTMAGGIASIVAGGVMTATGGGTPAGVGLIATGATALAGGTASLANTIKSTNAKIEDLKNTPDSFNVAGSSYVCDVARTGTSFPYLTIYECDGAIVKRANDYFYAFGYEVARDCHFNTQLAVGNNANNFLDVNIFTRTNFNYVQINEDITNKIDNDIPFIAKQKLSAIFNNGITLWTFFGFSPLWSDDDTQPTGIPMPDRWFLKNTYDNTEYYG